MGNHLSLRAEGTHEAEILQSPSKKDEAKAAGGYNCRIHITQEFATTYKNGTCNLSASLTLKNNR